jgi:DNA-binding SARP family transcriptional activator
MRFEILGPLAVRRDDRSVTPSGPRRRALLAVLLATAPEPVPISRLTRIIWADEEPVTGAALKMTVSRLRRWGKEHGWGSAIERVGAAYRLTLDNATLDSVIFRSRIAAAEELPETFVGDLRRRAP